MDYDPRTHRLTEDAHSRRRAVAALEQKTLAAWLDIRDGHPDPVVSLATLAEPGPPLELRDKTIAHGDETPLTRSERAAIRLLRLDGPPEWRDGRVVLRPLPPA